MRRYFINPELKISSGILLSMMICFLTATFFFMRVHHNRLKRDYVENLGAITARVIDMNPEMEKEIIPLITKELSEAEAKEGRVLLSQYGLTENLENSLFPNVRKTVEKNNMTMLLIFFTLSLLLFALNYYQYGYFYERIRRLTLGAKKVVEGEYDIVINENKEGDFSKLAVSFNSMREVIRNNLMELKKEKQFLVDLLSDISHQLKTPLSCMIVYNDIMINKELSIEQRRTFLSNNQSQLSRMQWLIQSILKLAKLDAKAIELEKENQSLNETLLEAVEALESKAQEAKVFICFENECEKKKEVFFTHDRLWLEEAFINIIKNGIEHTAEEGEIRIEILENPVYRRVIIEDTGEGIREEDLPNIFKRFYKAKTSKKSESIGIGLALAKAIVEAHNGMIEVQSRVSQGTKFIITFFKF